MKEYTRIFKLPDFKNIKEEREFYNRAYATFCVGYMDQIKNNIKTSSEINDRFFDNTEKREYKALIFKAYMPKFSIIGTDFSKIEKKEKVEKDKLSFKINKNPPKEKEKDV